MSSNLIINKSKKLFEQRVLKTINDSEKIRINSLNNIDIKNYGDNFKDLSTESLREFISTLTYKPVQLNNQYIIMYNFDRYNTQMQNITLKLLEESSSTIFINSQSLNSILDTVISRCSVYKIKTRRKINTNITKILSEIILNNDISNIEKLKKFEIDKVFDNLEIFMKNNNDKFENAHFLKALNKLYETRRNYYKVKGLNFELQFTNIIISLLNKKNI